MSDYSNPEMSLQVDNYELQAHIKSLEAENRELKRQNTVLFSGLLSFWLSETRASKSRGERIRKLVMDMWVQLRVGKE